VAGSLFIFSVVPSASWIVFAFGWMLFPTVGLLRTASLVCREAAPELRAGLRALAGTGASGSDVPPVVRSLRLNAERLAPLAEPPAPSPPPPSARCRGPAGPRRETLTW
jgi:hypothetical protein